MTAKPADRQVLVTDRVNGGTEAMTAASWLASHAALKTAVASYLLNHPSADAEIEGNADAGRIRLEEGPARLHLEWQLVPLPGAVITAPPASAPPILPRRRDNDGCSCPRCAGGHAT